MLTIIILHVTFSDNNYTVVNGLKLDMAPEIGPLSAKTVIIDKNDNAEGVIQFSEDAISFTGRFVLRDYGLD